MLKFIKYLLVRVVYKKKLIKKFRIFQSYYQKSGKIIKNDIKNISNNQTKKIKNYHH